MIDDGLRRIATASHRDIARSVDVDADLAEVRRRIAEPDVAADEVVVGGLPGRARRPRWVPMAAAGALTAAGIAAVVIWTQSGQDSEPPPATVPLTVAPSVPATPPGSTPASTTVVATTVPAAFPEPQIVPVDAADPPPLHVPEALVSIPRAPNPGNNTVSVAIGERTIAVRQPGTDVVTLFDYADRAGAAASVRDVPIDEPLFSTVLGPGDVLYGIGDPRQGNSVGAPDAFRFVAIPVSGEQAGDVVAESDLAPVAYLELPDGAFGHGPDGIVDRARDVNRTVLGYVDAKGNPVQWAGSPPPLLTWTPGLGDGGRVSVVGSDLAWDLAITKAADYGGDFIGPNPPAPTSGGRVVYSDTIGPDLTPDQDFGPNQMPVVAILEPDGSGRWIRLPDDWSVVASDVWGTVLQRTTADAIELALLDDVLVKPGSPSDDAELAERLGVRTLVTHRYGSGTVGVVRDGISSEIPVPSDSWPWSDGEHVIWTTYTSDGRTMASRSAAATFDGTVVCEVDGNVHRVRRLPDGTSVASVTRWDGSPVQAGEALTPLPTFAVDCATGEATPIETAAWRVEGGGRRTILAGDRTFIADADAEGNEHVVNESGISVNGDDYAGYHAFSADGGRVVYGDFTGAASPHFTGVVRARDTTTGQELWTATLPRTFEFLVDAGDRILVGLGPADAGAGELAIDQIVVLDAATGEQVTTVSADVRVLAAH